MADVRHASQSSHTKTDDFVADVGSPTAVVAPAATHSKRHSFLALAACLISLVVLHFVVPTFVPELTREVAAQSAEHLWYIAAHVRVMAEFLLLGLVFGLVFVILLPIRLSRLARGLLLGVPLSLIVLTLMSWLMASNVFGFAVPVDLLRIFGFVVLVSFFWPQTFLALGCLLGLGCAAKKDPTRDDLSFDDDAIFFNGEPRVEHGGQHVKTAPIYHVADSDVADLAHTPEVTEPER